MVTSPSLGLSFPSYNLKELEFAKSSPGLRCKSSPPPQGPGPTQESGKQVTGGLGRPLHLTKEAEISGRAPALMLAMVPLPAGPVPGEHSPRVVNPFPLFFTALN